MTYNERDFWDSRYASGGTSGAGSYGAEGMWKLHQIALATVGRGITSILDLGVGDGSMCAQVAGMYPLAEYVGVDVSAEGVALAKPRVPVHVDLRVGDITRDSLPSADLVLCLDVLFHLGSDEAHERAIATICQRAQTPQCLGRL